MKKIILAVFFLFTVSLLAKQLQYDILWSQRNVLPQNKISDIYKIFESQINNNSQNYEFWWKYSRALNFYGMYFAPKAEKLTIYTKAKNSAEHAVELAPDRIEGHIWLGVSLGNWGKTKGVLKSLQVVPDIEKNMQEVLTKNPRIDEAIAYRVLGRLYFLAPGRPLSVGSKTKSLNFLKKALDIAPQNKKNYLYIADVLYAQKKYKAAMQYINTALSKPIRPQHRVEELKDIQQLKKLKRKILAKKQFSR